MSFDKCSPYGECVAKILTPAKGPLVLPNHISDLQDWLAFGTFSSQHRSCCRQKFHDEKVPLMTNSEKSKDTKSETVAEQKLRDALLKGGCCDSDLKPLND